MLKIKNLLLLLLFSFILLISVIPLTFSSFNKNQYYQQEAKNASFDLDVSLTQNNSMTISDIDVGETYTINVSNPSNMYCTYEIMYNIYGYVPNNDPTKMSPWIRYVTMVVDGNTANTFDLTNSICIFVGEIEPYSTKTHTIGFDTSVLFSRIDIIESRIQDALLNDDFDSYALYSEYMNQLEGATTYNCSLTLSATTSNSYSANNYDMSSTYLNYSSYPDNVYYYTY